MAIVQRSAWVDIDGGCRISRIVQIFGSLALLAAEENQIVDKVKSSCGKKTFLESNEKRLVPLAEQYGARYVVDQDINSRPSSGFIRRRVHQVIQI